MRFLLGFRSERQAARKLFFWVQKTSERQLSANCRDDSEQRRFWRMTDSASSEEHVFSYARTGLKLTTFRHAWEGACTEAKISGLRFHDLRHTFATRLRGKGVHEMDIMTLLGHTTLQMTSRYTHAMPENLRTAVDSPTKQPLPFRPRPVAAESAPKSRQVATGTDGA